MGVRPRRSLRVLALAALAASFGVGAAWPTLARPIGGPIAGTPAEVDCQQPGDQPFVASRPHLDVGPRALAVVPAAAPPNARVTWNRLARGHEPASALDALAVAPRSSRGPPHA
jgi:hypothetical protein